MPLGGGLSSSAALEVATATLLETMLGQSARSGSKGAPVPGSGTAICRRSLRDHGSVQQHAVHRRSFDAAGLPDAESQLIPFTEAGSDGDDRQ